MKVEYGSIGRELTMRASIDDLSGRDKCSLFYQLMRDLGIFEELMRLPKTESQPFEDVWAAAQEKHWK